MRGSSPATSDLLIIDGTDLIWRQRGSYDLGNKYTTGVFDNVDTEEITLKVYPAEMKPFIQNAWSSSDMDKEWSFTKVVE